MGRSLKKRLRDDSESINLFSSNPSVIRQDASPPPKKVRTNIVQGLIEEKECDGFQPVMMTFKEFLQTQDDSITEEDSLINYREYKSQFSKQVLATFFNAHKDEEWFRIKYHPVELEKARQDNREKKSKRCEVFWEEFARIEQVRLNVDNEVELVKLLDTLVTKLEGGSKRHVFGLDLENLTKIGKLFSQLNSKEVAENPDNLNHPEGVVTVAESNSNTDDGGYNDVIDYDSIVTDGIWDKRVTEDDSVSFTIKEPCVTSMFHQTSSIHLRQVHPSISKAELEEMCGGVYPGFLRCAISKPNPEREFYRKGWLTFTKDVRIKEICLQVADVRIRGTELCPVINKDLTRRVRLVSGLANHKKVMARDLKLAAQLIKKLDTECGLNSEGESLKLTAGVEEVLKRLDEKVELDEVVDIIGKVWDAELVDLLDKLLIYLRVVHSVDWYNQAQYEAEDEMPHRLGLVHARAALPGSADMKDVDQYLATTQHRLQRFFVDENSLVIEEVAKLGGRDEETEVEHFIERNIQKLGEEKWKCLLSGKKFRSCDFVRKHILNKFSMLIQVVRNEIQYFNRFLSDPQRPRLPDKPKKVENKIRIDKDYLRLPPPPVVRGHYGRGRGFARGGGWGRAGIRSHGIHRPHLDVRADPRTVVDYSDMQDLF